VNAVAIIAVVLLAVMFIVTATFVITTMAANDLVDRIRTTEKVAVANMRLRRLHHDIIRKMHDATDEFIDIDIDGEEQ
jgi:hypothetical protein